MMYGPYSGSTRHQIGLLGFKLGESLRMNISGSGGGPGLAEVEQRELRCSSVGQTELNFNEKIIPSIKSAGGFLIHCKIKHILY